MHWSECDISWGRADHPTILPNPGNYPLVVDALFAGPRFSCKFSRVLVDGGSTINILYRDTLTKLGLTEKDLERGRTSFHGIVPGCLAPPWVAFGWMSYSAQRRISGGSRSGLRSPTSAVLIMRCWDCPHSPSSCSVPIRLTSR